MLGARHDPAEAAHYLNAFFRGTEGAEIGARLVGELIVKWLSAKDIR